MVQETTTEAVAVRGATLEIIVTAEEAVIIEEATTMGFRVAR